MADRSGWRLIGGGVYTMVGMAAGLPRRRVPPGDIADVPGRSVGAAAALAQLTVFACVPVIGPGTLVLIAWHAAPFLRRHTVAALRLQLWQLLVIVHTPVLFWPTIGLYTIVTLTAIFGGLVYSINDLEAICPKRREHAPR